MDKLNKLGLACLVMTIFVAGCGKKKEICVTQTVQDSEIPLLIDDSENLLDDDAFAEFAFVDDETLSPEVVETKDNASALVAENDDFELDVEAALVDDELEKSPAFKTVQFDFNQNDIRADQKVVVAQDVQAAQQTVEAGKDVVVEGHTCQIGSAGYNLALSQRRAESVKVELVKNGIPAKNVKTIGYGYERPLVWSDAQERAQLLKELSPNRRAEVMAN